MDAETVITLIGLAIVVGSTLVAVALHAGKTRNMAETNTKDIDALGDKVHKHGNRLSMIPEKPDDVYARKDTVAIELAHIRDSQERMEKQIATLVDRH